MRISLFQAFQATLGLFLFINSALAEPVKAPHVEAELVSEFNSLVGGQPFWVAVRLKMDPKWHTYWQNPGDSGLSTRIDWSLPKGLSVSEIQWPVPDRYLFSSLVNFGYENETFLLTRIDSPTSWAKRSKGTPERVKLEAKVRWLVCREICLPGSAMLNLEVPVRVATAPTKWKAKFDEFRKKVPQSTPGLEKRTKAELRGDFVFIEVRDFLKENPVLDLRSVDFFPITDSIFSNVDRPIATKFGQNLQIKVKTSENWKPSEAPFQGVIAFSSSGSGKPDRGVNIQASIGEKPFLLQFLFFALIGGLILNLMPCVFPVLSIKILSFVKKAHRSPKKIRKQGLVYSAGVLVSFLVLGGVISLLKAGGEQLGWGFQLQSPQFLVFLSYLFFVMALNLSGYFEMGSRSMGLGGKWLSGEGSLSSFLTGVLAVVVATPCTAPFMGSAIGFALSQPSWVGLTVFAALGVGMAMPYALLSYYPSFLKFLPKPGRWMQLFKEFMAFPLFATVVWLFWIFVQQVGFDGVLSFFLGLILILVSLWAWKNISWKSKGFSRSFLCIGLVLGLFVGLFGFTEERPEEGVSTQSDSLTWISYSEERLGVLRNQGKTVFLNFTAAWCLTCKVNERVTFSSEEVQSYIQQSGVVMMKADWTHRDPKIAQILARFGRAGIPFYLLYKGVNTEPIVLPEVLTPQVFLDSLKN